ncbi:MULTISPECIES: RNA 2'-phosphotransferase [unclassified Vibrio]|uniref:RNA 2'-phosphotransferase n=1 Tax=unclassified Vibrio TaxID=2614977 RepID=UPI0011404E34
MNYESYSPNSDLYHGTKSESVASILSNGLLGRKRNYVHLSVNNEPPSPNVLGF